MKLPLEIPFYSAELRGIHRALRNGRWLWRLLLAAQVILIPVSLLDAVIIQIIIDKVIAARNYKPIIPIITATFALFISLFAIDAFVQYKAIRLAQYWDAVVKNRFLRRVMQKTLAFFNQLPSGEILYRLLNDSGVLPGYMTQMRWDLLTNLVMAVSVITLLMIYDIPLALLTVAAVPLQIVALSRIGQKCRILQEDFKVCNQDLLAYLQNIVGNAESIKAFGLDDRVRHQWITDYRTRLLVERKLMVLQRIIAATVFRLTNLVFLLVLAVGSYRAVTGSMTAGKLMVFLLVGSRLAGPVQYIASYHLNLQDILTSLRRMKQTWQLCEPPQRLTTEFLTRPGCLSTGRRPLSIENFKLVDIGFSYENVKVLRNLTWQPQQGQIYRLIGHNGAGKSTLLRIMAHLLTPDSGRLFINDIPSSQFSIRGLRQKILYLSADSFWLRGSLKENLFYRSFCGNGHSTSSVSQLDDCLRITDASDIIDRLPAGMDTPINAGGTNLSRGEKQRFVLTAALLAKPDILLLDEALSSVNPELVPKIIRQTMAFLGSNAIVIYVHHGSDFSLPNQQIIALKNGIILAERPKAEQEIAK